MLWGSIWGVTGMVLAVPITAVLRIHMSYLEHPLPRYFALLLSGRNDGGDGDHDSGSERDSMVMRFSSESESAGMSEQDTPRGMAGDKAKELEVAPF